MTVFVVGLDGAEWSLLGPWMDDGGLPALSRLCDAGVAGGLRSTLPPITFPAWKCYSTGKTPGRLGVYEWFAFDREGPRIETNDSASFRSREYWDVLADEGHAPAVVNMPTTHPPNVDDGVRCVAGSPASERDAFTSPASLKSDLLDAVPGYRVKPDLVLGEATPDELVAEATTLAGQRFDAAEWLADDGADLVHLTVFVTDTLQHRLWDRPAHLRRLYEAIDERIGRLLDRDDADAVVVMSDHGFADIDERFHPNQWLAERGDLAVGEDTTRGALASVGLTEERAKRVVARLGLVNLAQAVVPDAVHSLFPSESGRTAIQDAPIDWDATRAISLGRGPIYLNDAAFESRAAKASYREELADALRDVRTPAGGPVATAVHDPADVYTGDLARAPDLLVEYATGVDAPEGIGGDVFDDAGVWLATHRRTGVFAACGEWVADGEAETSGETALLDIYDLAPTLLHAVGAPVPSDVDGEVRTDLLAGAPADRCVEEGPPTGRDAGGERAGAEVEETLRGLGYME